MSPYRALAAPTPARRSWWRALACRLLGHDWGMRYYDDRGPMSATQWACEFTGLAHHSWRTCERCGDEEHTRLYPSAEAAAEREALETRMRAAGYLGPSAHAWLPFP